VTKSLIFILIICSCAFSAEASKIEFWKTPLRGANFSNKIPTREWFEAAKNQHIEFVRMAPDYWHSQERDFLIGDTTRFNRIVQADLKKLQEVLGWANETGIKVVLTMLSQPGARLIQLNNNRPDTLLWIDSGFHKASASFWKQIASALKDHPALIGYDILNQPHPESMFGFRDFWTESFAAWYEDHRGTSADLNEFNLTVVNAIRNVDPDTPIIVESGHYGHPWAFEYLRPLNFKNVIYSFHMSEPYEYTQKVHNRGRYKYPGSIPVGELQQSVFWNRELLARFFAPVIRWQKDHEIPSRRIFVGEFSVDRTTPGAANYLSDLINVFETHKWHWAFYAFRPDMWDNVDYELGPDESSRVPQNNALIQILREACLLAKSK
jgi:endoglucanase